MGKCQINMSMEENKGSIYFHTGRIFAKSTLTDVFVSKLDTLYVSSPNINLSTSSKFIHSKKFNLLLMRKI